MKKVIICLFLAAGAFAVSAANAKTIGYNVSLEKNDGQVVKIDLDQPENVQLTVSDINGTVLYNYTNMQNSRSFDFSNLPVGNYLIKIENDRYAQTTLVAKSDSSLLVKKDYKFVLKPVFKPAEGKMNVYIPNPSNANIEIDVYDKDNYLVYSYTDDQTVINKVLDFTKSPYGKYTINVSSSKDDVNYTSEFEHE